MDILKVFTGTIRHLTDPYLVKFQVHVILSNESSMVFFLLFDGHIQ